MAADSELTIDVGANAIAMAEAIFGDGVTVISASYSGDNSSSGIYSGGDTTSPGVTPGDTGVIFSTGQVSDFTNASGESNQNTNTSTNTSGVNNNPDFNAAAGTSTFDASFLDVDFIPTASVMTMQFVFSSEEYPEFQNSIYQDFVGVWVNGVQIDMMIGNGDTDPGNVNSSSNSNLYVDNTADQYNTEMDGFTVTLTLTMPVNVGVVNSIRIGIADVGDSSYDSNLLIAGDSIQTEMVAIEDSTYVDPNGSKDLNVLANDINTGGGTLIINQINGIAVVAGDSVTLNTGQVVTLNVNGTLNIAGDGDVEDYNFTYTVSNGTNEDTGFVNVSSIPCFVAGTMIRTVDGDKPVEQIEPGDLVITRDEGPRPVRWAGSRQVKAEGDFAPIRIRAGTFGEHGDLLLSPQHRVLVRDSLAELLFGEDEVLVAAKDLLNDRSVLRRAGGMVTYVHLMFDRHQVIYSEGLPTESFLPGPQTTNLFEQPVVDEICTIFPDLNPTTGEGYSGAARRTLRRFEAQLLMAHAQAA